MAKLPTRDTLGPLPSARSGRSMSRLNVATPPSQFRTQMAGVSAIESGIGNLGKGMASLGVAAETLQQHELKQQEFDTEQKVQEFQWTQQQALEEKSRKIEPGAARDFANNWQSEYVENAKTFFKDVPEPFKAKVEERLFSTERSLYGAASTFGREEQKRFSTDKINVTTDNVYAPRARVTATEELNNVTTDYERLVAANPDLTPVEKDKLLQQGRAKIALAHVQGLPAERQIAVLSGAGDEVANRIIGVESGGNANAKNPLSSATGSGQFINSTWLSLIKEAKPEVAQGKSDQELLAMRSNPALSREMVKAYADKNGKHLQSNGLDPSPQNTYLAHFLGPGDAVKVLKAAPGTPIESILKPEVIAANKQVLEGRTAGDVTAWSGKKMGEGSAINAIPYQDRVGLVRQAEVRLVQERSAAIVNRTEEIERTIIDASSKPGSLLPERSVIENDPVLNDKAKNTLLRQYDSAAKDAVKLQQGMQRFANGGTFNQFNSDDRDIVDKIYKSYGDNPAALATVVNRTGVVPNSVAVQLRGGLVSSKSSDVEAALQTTAKLLDGPSQDIFAGVEGGKELRENALTFRHLVYDRGMSATDATKRIMEERTPEFERNVKAKIKSEDTNAIVKKNLQDTDIRAAFDTSFLGLAPNPALTFNPEMRVRAMGDYEEAFREHYARNGDIARSKTLALDEMKRTYGVTAVNGSNVAMKYPPERAPAYSGIENTSERFAGQAIAAIKEANGVDIERKNLIVMEARNTAERYMRGEPPTYTLAYTDKNGMVQVMPKPFFADPAAMKAAQTETRKVGFDRAREKYLTEEPIRESSMIGAP